MVRSRCAAMSGASRPTASYSPMRELRNSMPSFWQPAFRPDLRRLIPDAEGLLDGHGMPLVTGAATSLPGLYFCGQTTVPTGQLREIGIEAQRIAKDAKAYLARA
jgi:hypothetical protein